MGLNRAQLDELIAKHPRTIAERAAQRSAIGTSSDKPIEARENAIVVGATSDGKPVSLDLPKLVDGRLLIQGNSGAGKSRLLRRIFEQSFGHIQQLLIDSEGEFSTLAECFDVGVITAAQAERIGPTALALHIRSQRYNAILDLSDASAEDRLKLVAGLAGALLEVPDQHWHPMLVIIDEVQTLAPFYDNGDATPAARKAAIVALAELMGRGRKRGLSGIIATQRIAETSKSVISKATNAIIGRTVFDRDMERAGALLGLTAASSGVLRNLADGEFLGVGPALAGPKRVRFTSGPVRSTHKGRAPEILKPASIGAADLADLLATIPTADISPPAKATSSSLRGSFTPEEDAIIVKGYQNARSLKEIAGALASAGFKHRVVSQISTRAQALGQTSAKAAKAWTEEEDAILRASYENPANKIADVVGELESAGFARGRVAVQMRAITLNLTSDRVKYWSEPELGIALPMLSSGSTHAEVIKALSDAGFERGLTAIHKLAQKHNILRPVDRWSEDDIARLKQLYEQCVPITEIAAELGRPPSGIRSKASSLGFKQRKAWTAEERKVLEEAQLDGTSLIDVATKIGRPYTAVAKEAGRMNLDFSLGRKPIRQMPEGAATH